MDGPTFNLTYAGLCWRIGQRTRSAGRHSGCRRQSSPFLAGPRSSDHCSCVAENVARGECFGDIPAVAAVSAALAQAPAMRR